MELCADFSDDQLQRVASLSERRYFGPGDVIVDQGDTGVECFGIEEGRAGVYVRGEYVATFGGGSMIGEMALVGHPPRTAGQVADT